MFTVSSLPMANPLTHMIDDRCNPFDETMAQNPSPTTPPLATPQHTPKVQADDLLACSIHCICRPALVSSFLKLLGIIEESTKD
jgi:hypothetical protein